MKTAILVLMCFTALVACASNGAAFQFYVVIKPGETERFFHTIAEIAKEEDLETASSQTRFSEGEMFRVAEGRGHRIKLWVQNMVLGRDQAPNLCGVHHEPYPDPLEFIVFTEPKLLGSRAAAIELGERAFAKFQKAGFAVLRKPAICGAALLSQTP
jgi:hypothetical protein